MNSVCAGEFGRLDDLSSGMPGLLSAILVYCPVEQHILQYHADLPASDAELIRATVDEATETWLIFRLGR